MACRNSATASAGRPGCANKSRRNCSRYHTTAGVTNRTASSDRRVPATHRRCRLALWPSRPSRFQKTPKGQPESVLDSSASGRRALSAQCCEAAVGPETVEISVQPPSSVATDALNRYLSMMERVIRVFKSHDDAAQADRAELSAMTPQQRLDRALDLIAWYRETRGETTQGFARVARVVQLERR